MNCIRCQMNSMVENPPEGTDSNRASRSSLSVDGGNQNDVGGFAEISGCLHKLKSSERQIGTPLEEDLGSWGHHSSSESVPDAILQASAGDEVTFVFTNQVDGKLTPIESVERSIPIGPDGQNRTFHNKKLHSSSHQLKKESYTSHENSGINTAQAILVPKGSIKPLRTPGNVLRTMRKPNNVWGNQIDHQILSISSNASDDGFL